MIKVQRMSGPCQIPLIIEELVLPFLKEYLSFAIVKKNRHSSVAKTIAPMANTTGSVLDDIVIIIHHD